MADKTSFTWPNIAALWAPEAKENGLAGLASNQLLKINNDLTGIFSDHKEFKKLELPRLVVVGTQSSGKSSLLNGIIYMDLLPMGKTMVTRTPLDIRLTQTKNDGSGKGLAEFGNYKSGLWNVEKTFGLTVPVPTKKEIEAIRKEIEVQTDVIAGKGKAISSVPIMIKIYSPYVPDLSLVDLPGLTMVACTDKGQPADIKKQIRDLVSSYISQERTIILAVMQARPDLEVDMALELAKEHDPEGKRTMGILTKIDLMNKDTDISDYLQDLAISRSLHLHYGYYAVINRTSAEVETMNVQEGFAKEQEYFKSHPVYSKIDTQYKLGIPNLTINLSSVLIDHIKKLLPDILHELMQMQTEIDKKLQDLGKPPPADAESKYIIINQLTTEFWKGFVSSLEDRGAVINSGRKIKDIFVNFRKEVAHLDAFKAYDDKYFVNAIKNCEGNHMTFPTPPIEVLEHCLNDPDKRPIRCLRAPALNCAKAVNAELTSLVDKLLAHDKISRFPKLVKRVKDEVLNRILVRQQDIISTKIDEIIATEESYIWTEEASFHLELKKVLTEKITEVEPRIIRTLLIAYFETVKRTIENSVPKTIMCFFVKKIEKQISSNLLEKSSGDITNLLEESGEKATKRTVLEKQKAKIETARKAIESA
jgi:replication fork clamp-binding protein CrfC